MRVFAWHPLKTTTVRGPSHSSRPPGPCTHHSRSLRDGLGPDAAIKVADTPERGTIVHSSKGCRRQDPPGQPPQSKDISASIRISATASISASPISVPIIEIPEAGDERSRSKALLYHSYR